MLTLTQLWTLLSSNPTSVIHQLLPIGPNRLQCASVAWISKLVNQVETVFGHLLENWFHKELISAQLTWSLQTTWLMRLVLRSQNNMAAKLMLNASGTLLDNTIHQLMLLTPVLLDQEWTQSTEKFAVINTSMPFVTDINNANGKSLRLEMELLFLSS